MVPTYSRVLNAIEKVPWDLVKEYWGIRKSLQDLIESKERNKAQLAKIRTTANWKWGFKKDPQNSNKEDKEEDGDKKGSEEELKENQKEMLKRTLLLASC